MCMPTTTPTRIPTSRGTLPVAVLHGLMAQLVARLIICVTRTTMQTAKVTTARATTPQTAATTAAMDIMPRETVKDTIAVDTTAQTAVATLATDITALTVLANTTHVKATKGVIPVFRKTPPPLTTLTQTQMLRATRILTV